MKTNRPTRKQRRANKKAARILERRGVWSAFQPGKLPKDTHPHFTRLANVHATWVNSRYVVLVQDHDTEWGKVTQLMVARHDRKAVRSWADMQRLKNEIMGPGRVAVEVYPGEGDLVDLADMYHLWVMPEGFQLPFGLHLAKA